MNMFFQLLLPRLCGMNDIMKYQRMNIIYLEQMNSIVWQNNETSKSNKHSIVE